MKKSILAMLAAASMLSAVSLNANAATGNVVFKGQVEAAPCNIGANSLNQEVDFGLVTVENIKNKAITPEKFYINLTDCDLTTTNKQPQITFAGQTETGQPTVLLTSGTASNVGIQVQNANTAIQWGQPVSPQLITANTQGATVTFAALPVALQAGDPTEGNFEVTSTFTVAYQ